MNSKKENDLRVSIGMPVYNAESSIRTAIDSLLSQTFTDFELIISDNASTDSTPIICEDYMREDNRVRFFRQKNNMGATGNFMFVLEQAKYKYFMWAAADDVWNPHFIEKNVQILELNKNVVGSTSNVEFFGRQIVKSNPDANFTLYRDFIKNMPINASYERRAAYFLRYSLGMNMYSIFRTEELKKCAVYQAHSGADLTIILNVLKYGDLHVIDEVLLRRSAMGTTSRTTIESHIKQKIALPWIIFPYIPVTFRLAKILGFKIFMKNLSYFIKLNYQGERAFVLELLRLSKNRFLDKEKN